MLGTRNFTKKKESNYTSLMIICSEMLSIQSVPLSPKLLYRTIASSADHDVAFPLRS